MELFLAFLAQHDDAGWLRIVDRLQPAMHPVDRIATRIWFHFFPLALDRVLSGANAPALIRQMDVAGRWRLADQIDTSHAFLYGHQYWPTVKATLIDAANGPEAPGSLDLAAQIKELATRVAAKLNTDVSLVVGIMAIAVRTLQQVGPEQFAASSGDTVGPGAFEGRTAEEVIAARMRQDSQGLFGFLRGDRKRWTVTFDERYPGAQFPLIHSQHLTTAAAFDERSYRARDPRCSEGPIPVQCRSCSCGTCWIGVLGGAERLSPVDERERAKLAECGYIETDETHPPIRLACMAQAYGTVSIVIPPWNGVVGKAVFGPGVNP